MEDFGKPNCSKDAKTSRADHTPQFSAAFAKEAADGGFEAAWVPHANTVHCDGNLVSLVSLHGFSCSFASVNICCCC